MIKTEELDLENFGRKKSIFPWWDSGNKEIRWWMVRYDVGWVLHKFLCKVNVHSWVYGKNLLTGEQRAGYCRYCQKEYSKENLEWYYEMLGWYHMEKGDKTYIVNRGKIVKCLGDAN